MWTAYRVDTLASYGQLVGPPSYDDSTLFDRHGMGRQDTSASASVARDSSMPAGPPPLKITVTDPVKKVSRLHSALAVPLGPCAHCASLTAPACHRAHTQASVAPNMVEVPCLPCLLLVILCYCCASSLFHTHL